MSDYCISFLNLCSSLVSPGSTDEESDYELEYETLSHGSDETWYDVREQGALGTEEGGLNIQFSLMLLVLAHPFLKEHVLSLK
jgi:hypothetical protein